MGKRLIFLFVSMYGLILLINGWGNVLSAFPDADSHLANDQACVVRTVDVKTVPSTTSIGTKPCHPDKNLIRIKAWDNVLSFTVPPTWHFTASFDHIEKVKFISYNATMLAYDVSVADLRGPPQPIVRI